MQYERYINCYSSSHNNWCTGTLFNRIIIAQWEGMGDVVSARYKPALLPPCPTIRVLCHSNCQDIHPLHFWVNFHKFSTLRVKRWAHFKCPLIHSIATGKWTVILLWHTSPTHASISTQHPSISPLFTYQCIPPFLPALTQYASFPSIPPFTHPFPHTPNHQSSIRPSIHPPIHLYTPYPSILSSQRLVHTLHLPPRWANNFKT